MELSPIFTQNSYPGLNFDPIDSDEAVLNQIPDIYHRDFSTEEHYNWIQKEPPLVVSFLAPPSAKGYHKILKTTPKGYEVLHLGHKPKLSPLPNAAKTFLDRDSISRDFFTPENGFSNIEQLQLVDDPAFTKDFLTIEQKHPQSRTKMKIGVVYCKKGQIVAADMFTNTGDSCSPRFWEFLNDYLGKKIDLEGWPHYRGDMRPPGIAWYQVWKDIEVIFHVAPLLNAEEKRRLIGNDISMIYFFDEEDATVTFDPTGLDSFGEVPCVFSVVQPLPDGMYRIGFCSKKNITAHGPGTPPHPLPPEDTRDLVLTKMFNGLVQTNYCPPMNRLFTTPRKATLNELLDKWVPLATAAHHKRHKEAKKLTIFNKREKREKSKEFDTSFISDLPANESTELNAALPKTDSITHTRPPSLSVIHVKKGGLSQELQEQNTQSRTFERKKAALFTEEGEHVDPSSPRDQAPILILPPSPQDPLTPSLEVEHHSEPEPRRTSGDALMIPQFIPICISEDGKSPIPSPPNELQDTPQSLDDIFHQIINSDGTSMPYVRKTPESPRKSPALKRYVPDPSRIPGKIERSPEHLRRALVDSPPTRDSYSLPTGTSSGTLPQNSLGGVSFTSREDTEANTPSLMLPTPPHSEGSSPVLPRAKRDPSSLPLSSMSHQPIKQEPPSSFPKFRETTPNPEKPTDLLESKSSDSKPLSFFAKLTPPRKNSTPVKPSTHFESSESTPTNSAKIQSSGSLSLNIFRPNSPRKLSCPAPPKSKDMTSVRRPTAPAPLRTDPPPPPRVEPSTTPPRINKPLSPRAEPSPLPLNVEQPPIEVTVVIPELPSPPLEHPQPTRVDPPYPGPRRAERPMSVTVLSPVSPPTVTTSLTPQRKLIHEPEHVAPSTRPVESTLDILRSLPHPTVPSPMYTAQTDLKGDIHESIRSCLKSLKALNLADSPQILPQLTHLFATQLKRIKVLGEIVGTLEGSSPVAATIATEISHFVQTALSFLFVENRNVRFSAERFGVAMEKLPAELRNILQHLSQLHL